MTRDEEAASTSQRQVVNYYDILGRLPPELFNMVVEHFVVEDWRETARNLNRIRGGWRALNDRVHDFTPELKYLNEYGKNYGVYAVRVQQIALDNLRYETSLSVEDMHLNMNAAGSVVKLLRGNAHQDLAEGATNVSDVDKRTASMQGLSNHVEHLDRGVGLIMHDADVLVAGWAGDDRLHQIMIAGPGHFDAEWFQDWYDDGGDEWHQRAYDKVTDGQDEIRRYRKEHGATSRSPAAFNDPVRPANAVDFAKKLDRASPTSGYGTRQQRLYLLRSVAKGLSSGIDEPVQKFGARLNLLGVAKMPLVQTPGYGSARVIEDTESPRSDPRQRERSRTPRDHQGRSDRDSDREL